MSLQKVWRVFWYHLTAVFFHVFPPFNKSALQVGDELQGKVASVRQGSVPVGRLAWCCARTICCYPGNLFCESECGTPETLVKHFELMMGKNTNIFNPWSWLMNSSLHWPHATCLGSSFWVTFESKQSWQWINESPEARWLPLLLVAGISAASSMLAQRSKAWCTSPGLSPAARLTLWDVEKGYSTPMWFPAVASST